MTTTEGSAFPDPDPFCGSGTFLPNAPETKIKISEVYAPGDIENARIPHLDWEVILRKLKHSKECSKNTTDPYCMLITGGTGVGKTALINHYMLMNPPYSVEGRRVVPVLKVTTPSVPTMKALVNAAIISLLGQLPKNGTAEEQTERLLTYLRVAGVEQVIFDEFQHVIEHGRGKFVQEASDWLKNMITLSNRPIILVGMPRSIEILENAQLKRRFMNHCRLPKFVWSERSLKKFGKFLDRLEEALPFEGRIGLGSEEITHRMFYASGGMMGIVVKTVREAAHIAQKLKHDSLTLENLSQGYNNQVSEKKSVDPFLAEFKSVQAALEKRLERKKQTKNNKGDDSITSDDVFRSK